MHEKIEDCIQVVGEGTEAACNCYCKVPTTDLNPNVAETSATVTSIHVELDMTTPPDDS